MELLQALKLIDKLFNQDKVKSICLSVNHLKVLTALNGIRISKQSDGSYFVVIKNELTPCIINNYNTLSSVKKFIIKIVQDWQNRTYKPIVFDIVKNCNII